MLWELTLGGGLIALSVVIQVGFIAAIAYGFERFSHLLMRPPPPVRLPIRLALAALWMMAAHSIAIWLWAATFLLVGAFEALEDAFYFAVVCFTTLGFGDIVPAPGWRILSGLCAANGLMTFGVSTAFLVALMSHLWDGEEERTKARRAALQRARERRRGHSD